MNWLNDGMCRCLNSRCIRHNSASIFSRLICYVTDSYPMPIFLHFDRMWIYKASDLYISGKLFPNIHHTCKWNRFATSAYSYSKMSFSKSLIKSLVFKRNIWKKTTLNNQKAQYFFYFLGWYKSYRSLKCFAYFSHF